jgi:parvulin-like peptidyl-prolyl isomerase
MRRLLLVTAAACAFLGAACGAITPYAAKVNGERISQRDLDQELDAIRNNKAYLQAVEQQLSQQNRRVQGVGRGTLDSAFVSQVLTRRVLLQLVHDGLAARKIRLTAADLRGAADELRQSFGGDDRMFNAFPKSYRDLLVRRTAEVDALEKRLSEITVTDDSIRRYYDANPDQFAQTCTRHILALFPQDHQPTPADIAAARAKAAGWRARLDRGEDFAAMAKAESEDKGSGAQGGDLGCQPRGSFVREFEDAAAALQPGQISGPVQSQFGFHIIQLLSRKTQTLDEAAPQIRQRIQSQNRSAISSFIDRALAKAKITVNPRYGRFDRSGAQSGIVPPRAPSTTSTEPAAPAP